MEDENIVYSSSVSRPRAPSLHSGEMTDWWKVHMSEV